MLPAELASVPRPVLQDFVQRLLEVYAVQLGQAASAAGLQPFPARVTNAATVSCCEVVFAASSQAPETPQLQLRFSHDCKYLGCSNDLCQLCANNQHRRCEDGHHFKSKYIRDDMLRSECDASVRVELVDPSTGHLVEDANLSITLTVLNGVDYGKRLEAASCNSDQAAEAAAVQQCARVTTNRNGEPLLSASGLRFDERSAVVLQLTNGVAVLPDMKLSDSGRGAPLRLLVESRPGTGVFAAANIRYALSEPFQVLCTRARLNGKPAIPHVDDPVKNIKAIGDATVPKLERLKAAAAEVGVSLDNLQWDSITKVGEFRALATLANTDRSLLERLRRILCLTKDQWKAAYEHAMKAVEPDTRLRIWYPNPSRNDFGLVFECSQGNVLLEKPAGLVTADGIRLEAQLQHMPQERQHIRTIMEQWQPEARRAWYTPNHKGWAVFITKDKAIAAAQHTALAFGAAGANPAATIGVADMSGLRGMSPSPVSMVLGSLAATPGMHSPSVTTGAAAAVGIGTGVGGRVTGLSPSTPASPAIPGVVTSEDQTSPVSRPVRSPVVRNRSNKRMAVPGSSSEGLLLQQPVSPGAAGVALGGAHLGPSSLFAAQLQRLQQQQQLQHGAAAAMMQGLQDLAHDAGQQAAGAGGLANPAGGMFAWPLHIAGGGNSFTSSTNPTEQGSTHSVLDGVGIDTAEYSAFDLGPYPLDEAPAGDHDPVGAEDGARGGADMLGKRKPSQGLSALLPMATLSLMAQAAPTLFHNTGKDLGAGPAALGGDAGNAGSANAGDDNNNNNASDAVLLPHQQQQRNAAASALHDMGFGGLGSFASLGFGPSLMPDASLGLTSLLGGMPSGNVIFPQGNMALPSNPIFHIPPARLPAASAGTPAGSSQG